MDNIQLVDCFERLHQHLLRHQPDLEKRAESAPLYAYRSQGLSFFLTHLAALLTGLDNQTAEGRRRIRRLVLELDDTRPGAPAPQVLKVRDQSPSTDKRIPPAQEQNLRDAVHSLKKIDGASLPDPPDPSRFGMAFDRVMDRLEHLEARIGWVRKQVPSLSRLNAFRFLHRIGYPVVVPDTALQTFFFRLGLIPRMGSAPAVQMETCRVGASAALALQRTPAEVDLWIRAFTGAMPGLDPLAALCRRKPDCDRCPLDGFCHFRRFRRPLEENATAALPVKQWRPGDRPRERLLLHGAHALEDSELLAIILRNGSGKWNVLDLARRLLEKFQTLQRIEEAPFEELQKEHGIGKMKAIELKAVFELGRRLTFRRFEPGDSITSSDDVFRACRGRFERVKQEEFLLLMLNNKNQIIREEIISRGGLDASVVHPREVFKAALLASAAAVIFVHNHPSGNPEPSHDDYVITQRLEEAASFLQIRVLDHVIIGAESYYSFREGETIVPGAS